MTFDQIISNLQKKIYHPVYLLTGEEPYFIDMISDYIEENVLSDTEKEFNQNIVYGKDVDVPTIISYARRFPMMSDYQVLIVKEAQDIRQIEELAAYAENPQPSTLLVLCHKYKKIDKRRSLVKTVDKKGVFFESSRLYENKIPSWIQGYLKEKGYSITPKATMLLTDCLGADLSNIVNELGKLIINIPAGNEINDGHIEEFIGISKEYNVFELQKALGNRDIFKANQIVFHFAANEKENPLVKVITILNGFFTKLMIYHQLKDKSRNAAATALSVHPYFVGDYQQAATNYNLNKLQRIISLLREYDLKGKGVGNISSTDGELLKELVFKILH